jgi:hypothetical protein
MNDQFRRLFQVISVFAVIYATIGLPLEGGYIFLKIGAWLVFLMAFGGPFAKKCR